MKKVLYHIFFTANIISLVLLTVYMILFAKGHSADELQNLVTWRMNAAFGVFIFWIWNLIIWSKRDKNIYRFFALFFLIGIFTLYYYFIVLKNKWLEKQN